MLVRKDSTGKNAIVMENKEEYLINTQRCINCEQSFQVEDDYTIYCRWRDDYCCVGDWIECNNYQPREMKEGEE